MSDSRDYFGTVDSRITMDNTLGALLIGTLLGVLLFGMITLQVYTYVMDYPKDKWHLKFMVGFLFNFSSESEKRRLMCCRLASFGSWS